jgi:hypothetical protein
MSEQPRSFAEIQDATPPDRVNPFKGLAKYLPTNVGEIDRRDAHEDFNPPVVSEAEVSDFNIMGADGVSSIRVPFSTMSREAKNVIIGGALSDDNAQEKVAKAMDKMKARGMLVSPDSTNRVALTATGPSTATLPGPVFPQTPPAPTRIPFDDPLLDNDQPGPPDVVVIFKHPLGTISSTYHAVRQAGGAWLLCYDLRYPVSQQFVPALHSNIDISIPSLKIESMPVFVTGLMLSFGKLEVVTLLFDKQTAEAREGREDVHGEAGSHPSGEDPF